MQDPLKDLLDEQDKYEAKIAKEERKKREAAEAVRKLKRKAASERKAAERKARDHALIVLGAVLAEAITRDLDGADWEAVDYEAVRDFVGAADFRAYARDALRAPELEPAAAALRLRTWEQTGQWVPEPGPDGAGKAGAR